MPGKMSMKKAAKKNEEVQRGRGVPFFKAKEGDTVIRMLPPWDNEGTWPFLEVETHSVPGALPVEICGKSKPFLKKTDGYCYICDVVIPQFREGDSADLEAAEKMESKSRIYTNIIDRDNIDVGVQVWNFSYTMFRGLLTYVMDPEYGDITDPNNGTDMVLHRKGLKFVDTEYTIRPKRTATKLGDEFLVDIPQLSEIISPRSSSKLRELFIDELGMDFGVGKDASEEYTDEFPYGNESEEKGTKSEPEPEPESEPEPEPESESDGEIVEQLPILIPTSIKGLRRKKILEKQISVSDCFGEVYDEHSENCDECDAALQCAASLVESEPEEKTKPATKKRTTRRSKK